MVSSLFIGHIIRLLRMSSLLSLMGPTQNNCFSLLRPVNSRGHSSIIESTGKRKIEQWRVGNYAAEEGMSLEGYLEGYRGWERVSLPGRANRMVEQAPLVFSRRNNHRFLPHWSHSAEGQTTGTLSLFHWFCSSRILAS